MNIDITTTVNSSTLITVTVNVGNGNVTGSYDVTVTYLASPRNTYTTGEVLHIDGGLKMA